MLAEAAEVLITGGSDGIGKALAARFLADGAMVLVTGRSSERLRRVENELPGLRTFQNDIGSAQGREELARRSPGIAEAERAEKR